ncbi:MAG: ribosome biogenesis GTP-binding protein YihA/YsxC [Saprospiraceae bacterium]|nr:ribosome biogenesis GTP-binding protein YihA/YsxC [Saprospiraceae bacterium]
MMIHTAEYFASFPSISKCPEGTTPEYAFIGRSNVGKSSLINMLTNHKKLAKTSSTPGKTQMINYFKINDAWFLVDLPGYGYAKVSKKHRESFQKMIRNYLGKREQLVNTFVLIDSRIKPQENDLEFINWLGSQGLPFSIVFTKADKQHAEQTTMSIERFKNTLLETWEVLPPTFTTSAKSAQGRAELLAYIQQVNEMMQAK